MNSLQTTAIIALSMVAAARILLFDKRGKTHKPAQALIAYLMFVWLLGLVVAVLFKLYSLAVWGLIFGLAIHTGSILLAGGNISKIQPGYKHHNGVKKHVD